MIQIPEYIEGLIFDCDGTLVDSMPLHMKAWEWALTRSGGRWDHDFFFSRKGMREKDIVRQYNAERAASLDVDHVVEIKHAYFREHRSGVKPVADVVDVVRRYRGLMPMAVVSGGTAENVNAQLEAIGIRNCFSVILTANDTIRPKPSPEIFLEAAARLGVLPRMCQVFEDGDLGIEAARKAGMLVTDVRSMH